MGQRFIEGGPQKEEREGGGIGQGTKLSKDVVSADVTLPDPAESHGA